MVPPAPPSPVLVEHVWSDGWAVRFPYLGMHPGNSAKAVCHVCNMEVELVRDRARAHQTVMPHVNALREQADFGSRLLARLPPDVYAAALAAARGPAPTPAAALAESSLARDRVHQLDAVAALGPPVVVPGAPLAAAVAPPVPAGAFSTLLMAAPALVSPIDAAAPMLPQVVVPQFGFQRQASPPRPSSSASAPSPASHLSTPSPTGSGFGDLDLGALLGSPGFDDTLLDLDRTLQGFALDVPAVGAELEVGGGGSGEVGPSWAVHPRAAVADIRRRGRPPAVQSAVPPTVPAVV